jgi:hypothetical protein
MGRIKAVVLSPSYNYYTLYIRNKGLDPYEYPYYMGKRIDKLQGIDPATPIYWLEGWVDNECYTGEDFKFIKNRFSIHKNIAESWIENEGFKF